MKHSRIHEYVCDYVEGKLNPELIPQFEALMQTNEILKSFVENARRGKEHLHTYAGILIKQQEDSSKTNAPTEKKNTAFKLRFQGLYVFLPLIALLGLFVKIRI